jgi:hypothetical protein
LVVYRIPLWSLVQKSTCKAKFSPSSRLL